jgi:glycerol uptake facilitator-like aquaporin/protein-tyrosine-phosphatase
MTPTMQRFAAEGIGTAFLVAGVVGSGIMAQRLAHGDAALALLANTLATAGVLVAVILAFEGVSGAHFNPVVTLVEALRGRTPWAAAGPYVAAQFAGGVAGVAIANAMFGEPLLFASHHARHGAGVLLGEFVATFGLVVVIWGCSLRPARVTAFAVAAYIAGAYWFTSSTSFANPAVTVARTMSDTFAGIAPADAPAFVVMELLGGAAAALLCRWLAKGISRMKQSVLFVCIHNGARSQMAEAFLNALCPRDFEAHSAGIEPGALNPLAVAAMGKAGIDISRHRTKSVASQIGGGRRYDYVITVCDDAGAEACPVVPGAKARLHWSFPDPAALAGPWEERLARAGEIRDAIRERVEAFCAERCGTWEGH